MGFEVREWRHFYSIPFLNYFIFREKAQTQRTGSREVQLLLQICRLLLGSLSGHAQGHCREELVEVRAMRFLL